MGKIPAVGSATSTNGNYGFFWINATLLIASMAVGFLYGAKTVLLIILAFAAMFLIGCVVLGAIDDEEKRIFNWARSCPVYGGYQLTVALWPILLAIWAYYRITKE